MKEITNGLEICCNARIKRKFEFTSKKDKQLFCKRINLISKIRNDLFWEKDKVEKEHKLAEKFLLWNTTKWYYFIFHLLVLFEVVREGKIELFQESHSGLWKRFRERLKKKELEIKGVKSNYQRFFINYSIEEVKKWKIPSGHNLKSHNKIINNQNEVNLRFKSILKKITEYLKKKNTEEVNILEFFYAYRLKTNYRDVDFLLELPTGLQPKRYYDFYISYFDTGINLANALNKLIDDISKKRELNMKLGVITKKNN